MNELGRIIDGGVITPKLSAPEAFAELYAEALAKCRATKPDVIIVETPAATPRGGPHGFKNRSVLWLPNYGGGVASIYLAAAHHRAHRASIGDVVELRTAAADEWTRRYAAPTGRRTLTGWESDDHKERRVVQVETWWGLTRGSLGVKSKAGNVADAVLLAQWAIHRGACGRVLAFDPSVTHTGYCLLESPHGPNQASRAQ